MSDARATEAPAQAAVIATEEIQHPVEDETPHEKVGLEAQTSLLSNVMAEVMPKSTADDTEELEPEVRPMMKPELKKPTLDGKDDEEIDTLLGKASKQGALLMTAESADNR